MKKSIIIISLLIGITSPAIAAKETVNNPIHIEFADKLVAVFGGKDQALSQAELVRVMDFLQANLPEKTGNTSLANRLSRQNNARNAARGDMSEERLTIRENSSETAVRELIANYDSNKDNYVTKNELAVALENVIGIPRSKVGISQDNIAQN